MIAPGDVDAWLASLIGDTRDVSLVAVGSLGRGERTPYSDLDLVLVHRGRRDIAEMAERIWQAIADEGLTVDGRVRTVAETVAAADGDLQVALGLLDARHVAGDPRLTAHLHSRVQSLWRARARQWLPAVRADAQRRHEEHGDVAFVLEPELKNGRGGVRDAGVLRALQSVTTVLGDLLPGLAEPTRFLLDVRDCLHRHAGRATDRLVLQDQDAIAAALGLPDADALLIGVSGAGRTIGSVWDACWYRIDGWLGLRSGDDDRPLGMGIALRDGEVHAYDPTHWLAAAVEAATHHAPLARTTLDRLADALPTEAPDPWPFGWRRSFVALLGAGRGALPVLEALDRHDLLVRLLPEWDRVRYKPQRNAYHRFTVDRHLLETAANAAALTRNVARPDLLLLGALLHDIGKGVPDRDHTVEGMAMVERIGRRIGMPPDDVATLVAMVEHHLLLAEMATRRDVDDPATVAAVADAAQTRSRLELLHALTEADSRATGPSAWSAWKASLVQRLVERATAALAGAEPVPQPDADVGALVTTDTADGLHVIGDGRCLVVAVDRPGLLSGVAGVLAVNGVDILAATIGTAPDGRAVEVFDVDGTPDWSSVQHDLDRLLTSGDLRETNVLNERRPSPTAPPARVVIDNEASARATVVDVRAPDDVGVLFRITRAIASAGLDVRAARVDTLGQEVFDAFYVVDERGEKIDDPARLAELEAAILYEVRST